MTLIFATDDEATRWALEWLKERRLAAPGGTWKTPKELAAACDLSAASIGVRLRNPRCPQTGRKVGPTGRIVEVFSTPKLIAFLAKPKQPGRRTR